MATKAKNKLAHIEADQGVTFGGRVYGYDHRRANYIVWRLDDSGRIAVEKVEPDEQADSHGSAAATLRDAKSVAARENRLPASRLLRSIQQGLRRP